MSELPQVALGKASLVLRELLWTDNLLSTTFAPAETQLVNQTDSSLSYQVRGPFSRWSETRTLAAGARVSIESGAEVSIRPARHWEFDEVSLPPGSCWECRQGAGRKLEWVRTDKLTATNPQ
jgi:hypothetical protein